MTSTLSFCLRQILTLSFCCSRASSMRNHRLRHRLRRILRVQHWTGIAPALLALATKTLVTSLVLVLYALTDCCQTVIRDGNLLNKNLHLQVSRWPYKAHFTNQQLMNGTFDFLILLSLGFWLNELDWMNMIPQAVSSMWQTADEVVCRLGQHYFMVHSLFSGPILLSGDWN